MHNFMCNTQDDNDDDSDTGSPTKSFNHRTPAVPIILDFDAVGVFVLTFLVDI